jgi:hypothetical protein
MLYVFLRKKKIENDIADTSSSFIFLKEKYVGNWKRFNNFIEKPRDKMYQLTYVGKNKEKKNKIHTFIFILKLLIIGTIDTFFFKETLIESWVFMLFFSNLVHCLYLLTRLHP